MTGPLEPETKRERWEWRNFEIQRAHAAEAKDLGSEIEKKINEIAHGKEFTAFLNVHARDDASPMTEQERAQLDRLIEESARLQSEKDKKLAALAANYRHLENEARAEAGLPSVENEPFIAADHDWATEAPSPDVSGYEAPPLEPDSYVPDHDQPEPYLDWEISD